MNTASRYLSILRTSVAMPVATSLWLAPHTGLGQVFPTVANQQPLTVHGAAARAAVQQALTLRPDFDDAAQLLQTLSQE